jgi:hypothetical protein
MNGNTAWTEGDWEINPQLDRLFWQLETGSRGRPHRWLLRLKKRWLEATIR